jgi:hypothetical protein
MIEKIYNELKNYFKNINLKEYVIMPNHFHFIIEIVGVESISAQNEIKIPDRVDMESTSTITISNIIQTFKRYTTLEYIKMVKNKILPPFEKRIWQRNYYKVNCGAREGPLGYENIVRNEKTYIKICEYIENNPLKWKNDKYYV